MKKRHQKGLQKLASSLPRSMELVKFHEVKLGKDLTTEEIGNSNIVIAADSEYKAYKQKLVEVDHYNRLKKAYVRDKERGIIDYIHWVDSNNKRMNELFEKLNLERVSEGIMDIAAKGVGSFWNNLIAFFFAFIANFKPKKEEA